MSTTDYKAEAKQQAEALLDAFWTPGRFPVDPVVIARQMGIQVALARLPEGVSGSIQRRKGSPDTKILIAASEPPGRRAFTCAHEIGHYVLRQADEVVDFTDYRNGDATSYEERFANAFAANLLMPEAQLRAALLDVQANHPPHLHFFALAQKFGVSDQAVRVRLASLPPMQSGASV